MDKAEKLIKKMEETKKKIDNLESQLNDLQKLPDKLNRKYKYSEIFNESFLKANTKNKKTSLTEYIKAGGWGDIPFKEIPEYELDFYVFRTTKFSTFKEMRDAALQELVDNEVAKIMNKNKSDF